jgi:hypothetical protein
MKSGHTNWIEPDGFYADQDFIGSWLRMSVIVNKLILALDGTQQTSRTRSHGR